MKLYWSQKDSRHIKTGFVVSASFLRFFYSILRFQRLPKGTLQDFPTKKAARGRGLSVFHFQFCFISSTKEHLYNLEHQGNDVETDWNLTLKSPQKKMCPVQCFIKIAIPFVWPLPQDACQDTGHGTYFPQERTAFFMLPKVLRISKTSLVSPSSPTWNGVWRWVVGKKISGSEVPVRGEGHIQWLVVFGLGNPDNLPFF